MMSPLTVIFFSVLVFLQNFISGIALRITTESAAKLIDQSTEATSNEDESSGGPVTIFAFPSNMHLDPSDGALWSGHTAVQFGKGGGIFGFSPANSALNLTSMMRGITSPGAVFDDTLLFSERLPNSGEPYVLVVHEVDEKKLSGDEETRLREDARDGVLSDLRYSFPPLALGVSSLPGWRSTLFNCITYLSARLRLPIQTGGDGVLSRYLKALEKLPGTHCECRQGKSLVKSSVCVGPKAIGKKTLEQRSRAQNAAFCTFAEPEQESRNFKLSDTKISYQD
uniref:Uncharacterized protein n=1 Tax=Chromera velia CCMP2878 TaxID=1169474 RepID=A0A0G4IGA2_9ALVE|eukprot:Cvel_2512.t1-p1 / transcript=Cvel_2512.t1 / gene=Cvel_2512 / organism=Chromera_velia_CCMP2878 / gene_product=hypothetical protein / transcript_product=hypothetical protein / location=Cvel_scaffold99:22577-23419(-) / protein_length=281 / sequence_SO=supercontig / SO=protein_coding / is_pseudo=false